MKRTSELTINEIRDILMDMDWREIEKARHYGEHGTDVVLFADGEWNYQQQNTYFRDPDAAGVLYYLGCAGGEDAAYWAEGWAERTEDGDYKVDEDAASENAGKVITEDEMVEEALENAEMDIDLEVNGIVEQIEQERRYQEEVFGD